MFNSNSSYVTKEEIQKAKTVNLYEFLIKNHSDKIKREGRSLKLRDDHSVSVKENYSGYYDFATARGGNAIDCLINYFNYTFVEAVQALCERSNVISRQNPREEIQSLNLKLPERYNGTFKNLIAYLTKTRKIPSNIVQKLLDEQLIYQESEYNNIIFVNNQRTFAEVHGTVSYGKSFHGIVKGSDPLAFWWFKSYYIESEVKKVFICESAIDAISLHCLNQARGDKSNYLYCSIAGTGNQQKIQLLKSCEDVEVVLAVDNDMAGDVCRQKNKECETIIPKLKDWNDDWKNFVRTDC